MNYERIYFEFVESFKNQTFNDGDYTEKHHIIPRYAGGGDNEENLVRVSYRQHIFLHKVLYAWKGNIQDKVAVKLMTSIDVNKKQLLCSMAGKIGGKKNVDSGHIKKLGKLYGKSSGKRNVENGQLDRIRHLANTPEQREKARQLGLKNVESGQLQKALEKAWEATRNRVWTDEQREAARNNMYERCKDPAYIEKLKQMSAVSNAKRKEESYRRSLEVLNSKVVFEEYLHKVPKKQSKYYFVTPNGLVFETAYNMAMYFGLPKNKSMLESWCKNNMHGWSVKLKSAQD